MIFEKDGKFYEKIEVEREISEMEYLKRKVKELEEKINGMPGRITIYPVSPPETPYQPYGPIWYYEPTYTNMFRVTCDGNTY
jgi:hypothetical protein